MTKDIRKTKITSTYAMLDVKVGRGALAKHFNYKGSTGNPEKAIPIIIYGVMTGVHGNDDGTSREFTIEVAHVDIE